MGLFKSWNFLRGTKLDQPVGHIIQLRLYPIRRFWSLGSGWAAIGGSLAVAGFVLSPQFLLYLFLVWLLADPILGTMWDLGAGHTSRLGHRGIWRRLLSPRLPDVAPPVRLLPYTQPGSPGYRLEQHLGRLRLWWHDTFWPAAGREFATLIAALGLALLLGTFLGRDVLVLVLLSIALSWLAVLAQGKGRPTDVAQSVTGYEGRVALWHALGEFCIPWLIGTVVMGGPSWAVVVLGVCYSIAYFGLIRFTHGFRLIGISQATAALLLAGLRHPLAAAATVIMLMPQWGLSIWAANPPVGQAGEKGSGYSAATDAYLRGIQPFIILSMLLGALAIAS